MTAIAKRTGQDTLPLTQHGLDVACCLEALLEQPVYEARVSAALGAPLDPVTRERLLLLSFLHDLGKASAAFQARIRGGRDRGGHLSEVVALVMAHPDLARRALLGRAGRAAPVILDDALIFADDERIKLMFDVLHLNAPDMQLLVLSCRQSAFSDLGGRVVAFEADGA